MDLTIHKEILFPFKKRMLSSRPEKRSERRSIVPRRQEEIVVSPPPHPPQPSLPAKFYDSLFGKKTLLILGILSSILALSISLWSLHKNSDVTRRINTLNSSVADLIVATKTSPVVEVGRRENEPSNYRRRGRVDDSKPKLETRSSQMVREIQMETAKADLERRETFERMQRETEENIREMQRAGREAVATGTKFQQKTSTLSSRVNPKDEIRPPVFSTNPSSPALDGMMNMISGVSERVSEKMNPRKFVDDVDMEDLERDLRLLSSDQ